MCMTAHQKNMGQHCMTSWTAQADGSVVNTASSMRHLSRVTHLSCVHTFPSHFPSSFTFVQAGASSSTCSSLTGSMFTTSDVWIPLKALHKHCDSQRITLVALRLTLRCGWCAHHALCCIKNAPATAAACSLFCHHWNCTGRP